MNEPVYTNKAVKMRRVIVHKTCKKEVIKQTGGRLWCATCARHVDAIECYHDEMKTDE